MLLFTVKSKGDDDTIYCHPYTPQYAYEKLKRSSAEIHFSLETEQDGIVIEKLLGNEYNAVMRIRCNPIEIIDDIYKFIYGKPLEKMYEGYDHNNPVESMRATGAIKWTKERALKINWELLLATLYAFYFSKENFDSGVWGSLSQLLEILKEFDGDEWKKVLFGRTPNIESGINAFWSIVFKIIFVKSSQCMSKSIYNIDIIKYVRHFVNKETLNDLELYACSELKKQLESELHRFKHTEGINSDNVVELYYNLLHFINHIADNFRNIENPYVLKKINCLISDAFEEIGDISTLYGSYKIANKSYIYAMIFADDKDKITTLRQKNKSACEFVPKSEQIFEKKEKQKYYSRIDEEFKAKLERIKNLKFTFTRIGIIGSVLLFAFFLIITIIGLIVSSTLFSFYWKALLFSLVLLIVMLIVAYHFEF